MREEDHYGDEGSGQVAIWRRKARNSWNGRESYDTAGPERRSLVGHEEWLKTLTRPILRLDSSRPIDELIAEVLSHSGGHCRSNT